MSDGDIIECHEQTEFTARLKAMSIHDLGNLLDFANEVQAWSLRGHRRTPRYGTFAQAAEHFRVPVDEIGLAVEAHYWMFADDPAAPVAERRIEHEGE